MSSDRPKCPAALRCMVRCLIAGMLAAFSNAGGAQVLTAGSLHAKYADLRVQLDNNQFQKPIHLESAELADGVSGDIYALVDHPFTTAAAALSGPGDWCEILILPINTKYCRATTAGPVSVLHVRIGKKSDQPLEEAYPLDFSYRVTAHAEDYLRVRLEAALGPLSTRDYRIILEAVPVAGNRTFIHLSYSYAFDMVGRLAMQVYLGTSGRGKVGFTVAGTKAGGQAAHIGGTRGVVERNTMRYFLAIESFLGALAVAPAARLEKRLSDWFAAAERYPRQLHDMERGEGSICGNRPGSRRNSNSPGRSNMFKMQVQDDKDDPRSWHDVKAPDGSLLTFEKEAEARVRLETLYPAAVKMEKYTGPKTTRVIAILEDEAR